MATVKKILKYLQKTHNLNLTEEEEEKLNKHIYGRCYANYVYWYIYINDEDTTFFGDGIISKPEYDKLMKLDMNTKINFKDIIKYSSILTLNDLNFKEEIGEVIAFLDNNKVNTINLMNYVDGIIEVKDNERDVLNDDVEESVIIENVEETCECGSVVKKNQMKRHLKTKRHIDFVKNNEIDNIEENE